MQLLLKPSHCGCLSEDPKLPRHLWTDAAVHVEACTESHGGHFEYKLNILGHMLIWIFCLVLVCGTRPKICRHILVRPIYTKQWWNRSWQGKPEVLWEIKRPTVFFSTINPLETTSGIRRMNFLSYDMKCVITNLKQISENVSGKWRNLKSSSIMWHVLDHSGPSH
jgi:hypothetical protein